MEDGCQQLVGFGSITSRGLIGVAGAIALLVKWQRLRDRCRREFILDTSKQVAGVALLSFILDPLASTTEGSVADRDACVSFWVTTVADAVIGIVVNYVLFNILNSVLHLTCPSGHRNGDADGSSGTVPLGLYWKQLAVWLVCITISKLVSEWLVMIAWPTVGAFAWFLLEFAAWSPPLKLVIVSVITPCCVGVVQFWATDEFLKKGGLPLRMLGLAAAWCAFGCLRKVIASLTPESFDYSHSMKSNSLRSRLLHGSNAASFGPSKVMTMAEQCIGHTCLRGVDQDAEERHYARQLLSEREAAESQIAEEGLGVAEARGEVRQEVQELQAALASHCELAAEDTQVRLALREQILDLEAQLRERDQLLRNESATQKYLRSNMEELRAPQAAIGRAGLASSRSPIIIPYGRDSLVINDHAPNAPNVAPYYSRSPEATSLHSGCGEVVRFNPILKLSPTEAMMQSVGRGNDFDRRIADIEAKVFPINVKVRAASPRSDPNVRRSSCPSHRRDDPWRRENSACTSDLSWSAFA